MQALPMIASTAMKWAPTLLSAGSAISQYSLERGAGNIQAIQAETQAKQEELAATQREADRKQRLISAMASQTARAGASGIAAFEGSPLTILQESIASEERATERDIFQTRLSALTTRARGQITEKTTAAKAKMSLLKTGLDIAKTLPAFGD